MACQGWFSRPSRTWLISVRPSTLVEAKRVAVRRDDDHAKGVHSQFGEVLLDRVHQLGTDALTARFGSNRESFDLRHALAVVPARRAWRETHERVPDRSPGLFGDQHECIGILQRSSVLATAQPPRLLDRSRLQSTKGRCKHRVVFLYSVPQRQPHHDVSPLPLRARCALAEGEVHRPRRFGNLGGAAGSLASSA